MTVHGEPKGATFYDIVQHSLDDTSDPVISELFDHITDLEIKMNSSGAISDRRKGEIEAELNDYMRALGLIRSEVTISGYLRPGENSGLEEGIPDDDDTPKEFHSFGSVRRDEWGPYYSVHGKRLVCGEALVIAYPMTIADNDISERYSICLLINISDEDDPSDAYFYTYPDQLVEFLPTRASDQKIDRVLHTKYPEIAAQLDVLPKDCGDDRKIIRSLQKFSLWIDWQDYPGMTTEESKELIDYIERYITDRVNFDTERYLVRAQGEIFAHDSRGELFPVDIGKARNITALIGGVQLRIASEEEDDSVTGVRFGLALEFHPSTEERGSDSHYATLLPMTSVIWARSLRNQPLFSPEILGEHGVQEIEVSDPIEEFVPVGADDELYDDGNEDGPSFTVDADPLGVLPPYEARLSGVAIRFGELMQQIEAITGKPYGSLDDANEAAAQIKQIMALFQELYPSDRPIVLEVEGPGVRSFPVKIDAAGSDLNFDKGSVAIRFDGTRLQQSDIFTPERVLMTSAYDIRRIPIPEFENGYRIEVIMYCKDVRPADVITLGEETYTMPFFTVETERRVAVLLESTETRITLPDYERLKSCREAITRVAMRLSTLPELPRQLIELQNIFGETDPVDMLKFEDIDLLTSVSAAVKNQELGADLVADVLNDILQERPLLITGAMYNGAGNLVPRHAVMGKVSEVVPSIAGIPALEPMIVHNDSRDGTVWYIPLSSIKELRY